MTPAATLVLPGGFTFTGALVSTWPVYRLVLPSGEILTVPRRHVLAISSPPAPPAEPARTGEENP